MRKILFILLAVLMTGCASLVGQAQGGSDSPSDKWQDANISHYRYDLAISCFCIFAQDMPLVIEVKEGEVVSMEFKNGNEIDPSFLETFQRYDTIDKILAEVEKAQSGGADHVNVTFDETYGYPKDVAIDFEEQAADEEIYLTISNFEVLP